MTSAHNFSLIFAQSKNGVIGHKRHLPWKIPEDMRLFKQLTLSNERHLLMGRVTYEGFHGPLKDRICLVLSRQPQTDIHQQIHYFSDIPKALTHAANTQEIQVVGGVALFEQFLPRANQVYVTCINQEVVGNVRFDLFEKQDFKKYSSLCFPNTQQQYNLSKKPKKSWQPIAYKPLTELATVFCFYRLFGKFDHKTEYTQLKNRLQNLGFLFAEKNS